MPASSQFSTPPSFRFQTNPDAGAKPPSSLFKPPRNSISSSVLGTPQLAKPPPSSLVSTRKSSSKKRLHTNQTQSQFAPTPRFTVPSSSSSNTQRRGSLDDTDVEVEIQDSSPLALQHSPKLPSRSRYSRGVRKGRDLVEDVDDLENNTFVAEENDTRPEARHRPGNILPSIVDASISHDPPTSSYKRHRKRRRLFYYSEDSRSSSEREQTPSPEKEMQPHLDVTQAPRFIFHPRDNLTSNSPLQSVTKPSFILPTQTAGSSYLDPSAFSPSHRDRRRRGGHRYLPDGLADTVRSWVLELAAQNASPLKNKGKAKEQEINGDPWSGLRFRVAEIGHRNGGGARAKCVRDGKGSNWLLMGSGMSHGCDSKEQILELGSMVAVRKGSVTWVVELPEDGKDTLANEDGGKLYPWTVVLEWTVLRE